MLITLEGIEGSGKTTQIRHMSDFFKRKGRPCVVTREPGGTRIGERIRSILLDASSHSMDPLTELLLYMADRVQHLQELIYPALESEKTVICDRFFDATVVYQGYARGLDVDWIRQLHRIILKDFCPDLTFLLDVSPEIGLSRAWKAVHSGDRGSGETRFEQEALSFHQKVREGYLTLAAADPHRFRVIDASQSEEKVRQDIMKALSL